MAAVTNATPLISLDAVVIDTETTGLDPRKARLVEIGAVRLAGGRIDPNRTFRSLVRIDEKIPAKVTAVHGIDAAKLANAPSFAEVWPRFLDFLGGDSVVIGHTLGFDLAILRHECMRAGLTWSKPRSHATACAGDRARSCGLFARATRQLARGRADRPAFGARRRHDHGAHFQRTGSEIARRRHPHFCGSRAGLSGAHQGA